MSCDVHMCLFPVWTQLVRRSGCANRSWLETAPVHDRNSLMSTAMPMTVVEQNQTERRCYVEQLLHKMEQGRRTDVGHLWDVSVIINCISSNSIGRTIIQQLASPRSTLLPPQLPPVLNIQVKCTFCFNTTF